MFKDRFAAFLTLIVVLTLVSPSAVAQSTDRTMPMRTPDGQPHISGVFTFRTLTPFERPSQLEGREKLSAEEAAAFEASERARLNNDLLDPDPGGEFGGFYRPRSEGGVIGYNEFWYERGIELTADKRTSLVIDPPDGRLPPRTAQARRAARERAAYQDEHRYDSYENRGLSDRCIMGFNSGPPMRSHAYNNNVMIFQVPGYVTILNEMVHNARIIPLDDTAKPAFPKLAGVSRAATGRVRRWSSRLRSSGVGRAGAPGRTCTCRSDSPASTLTPSSTNTPSGIQRCTPPPTRP